MATLVTGATGYLGSYVTADLLSASDEKVAVLVRASSLPEAHRRLWHSLQLQMDFQTFSNALRSRMDVYLGDLTLPGLGLDLRSRKNLVDGVRSVIHCAASLNRRSEKACLNVNLRGTLQLCKLAREIADQKGLRRFSEISTVAIAGTRLHETLSEEEMLDWNQRDYDPYARTKKFCEYMVHELLPQGSHMVFRPSIILGDSRFPQTTQFDMVRAFVWLAQLPVLPFSRSWKLDIVPADYVSQAIVTLHQKQSPKHSVYNITSGKASLSYQEIVSALQEKGCGSKKLFWPFLQRPIGKTIQALSAMPRGFPFRSAFSLLRVFWPYLVYDTVFDNSHLVEEIGRAPKPFGEYAPALFRFAKKGHFTYAYQEWPMQEDLKGEMA